MGRKYVPPKLPAWSISAGVRFGRNRGASAKTRKPDSSRTGNGIVNGPLLPHAASAPASLLEGVGIAAGDAADDADAPTVALSSAQRCTYLPDVAVAWRALLPRANDSSRIRFGGPVEAIKGLLCLARSVCRQHAQSVGSLKTRRAAMTASEQPN